MSFAPSQLMSKSTRYRITLPLMIAALMVITGSFLQGAPISDLMDNSIFFSINPNLGRLRNFTMENVLFVQESAAKESLLRMVLIRTTPLRGLKQLRGMDLDIISVKADPDRIPGEELFSGGYIVEAVVTKGQLAKLKKMGFEVCEIPDKK